jgi:hypothetical protein
MKIVPLGKAVGDAAGQALELCPKSAWDVLIPDGVSLAA